MEKVLGEMSRRSARGNADQCSKFLEQLNQAHNSMRDFESSGRVRSCVPLEEGGVKSIHILRTPVDLQEFGVGGAIHKHEI
jgi:hypothetical protein